MKQPPPPEVLILLVYYNRPILVRRALESVLESHARFQGWKLAVLDDGSPEPVEPIAREVLAGHEDRISFYNSGATIEDKVRLGSTVGGLANCAIAESSCPVCVTLCDDDALHPGYLAGLSRYLGRRRDVAYCYSHVSLYNPLKGPPCGIRDGGSYNRWTIPIDCRGRIDGSQVAFRTSCIKAGAWWETSTFRGGRPFEVDLDREMFGQMFDRHGPAPFTGLVSQYKGVHDRQMVATKKTCDGSHMDHYLRDVELGV